jgi:hypothetical protein
MALRHRVARGLLGAPVMLRLMLVPLLLSAGCLFTGDLNQAPKVMAKPSAPSTTIGVPITMRVQAEDADHDELSVVQNVRFSNGQPTDPVCDYLITAVPGTAAPGLDYMITFYRAGAFKVFTRVKDAQGALSNETSSDVTVSNSPPSFSPDSKLAAAARPEGACGYTAKKPVPIAFTGTPLDPDVGIGPSAAACPPPESLSYAWSVATPSSRNPDSRCR